jgi:hypothetical protein
MGFRRKTGKQRLSPIRENQELRPTLLDLGNWGERDYGLRIIRVITKESLDARTAALVLGEAAKFADGSNAELVITPGGFGVAEYEYPYSEEKAAGVIATFVNDCLSLLPDIRNHAIILGVDTHDGKLQDAYYVPKDVNEASGCVRVWKSYPRLDEARFVITKGRTCPNRSIRFGQWRVSILVCHDLASFARRSQVTRGGVRETWARQLDTEVARGKNTAIVHLIHYLDNSSQGMIFTSGMEALVNSGVTWGISAFKTPLDAITDRKELKEIEDRTTRFAGETLDLYVDHPR